MEHVNGCCFRGIYKGGLWEDDLHVSALGLLAYEVPIERFVYSQRRPKIRLCPYFCPSAPRFSASGLGLHG